MKTYVLDASALFVFLLKQSGAEKVGALLKEAMRGGNKVLMSSVNYGEVYGSILRQHGLDRALATMSAVKLLPIELADATPQRAMQASDVKTKYKLYYVDSFAAALAMEYKATLVTGDSDFKKLGRWVAVMWLI